MFFLFPRLEHPAGWICARYKSLLLLLLLLKLHQDVGEFCRTCHTCQVVGKPNQKIQVASLIPIPACGQPFDRVIIDCVGPLPKTRSGHMYLLTMDASTRYPEAIPLRNITAKSVSEALVIFFY